MNDVFFFQLQHARGIYAIHKGQWLIFHDAPYIFPSADLEGQSQLDRVFRQADGIIEVIYPGSRKVYLECDGFSLNPLRF